ncbi:hypothetical protein [Ligilactobacillus equi]|uniref:Uncharacterized protein n=2 Tax=Ligilactobacillus equi TaxID=137357 RepID=A0A0R1TZK5_9LACO|nr:hypothetical protein [Ligilactobacillus equi]KRL84339.1 hypothetical protein FC36_GL000262 [Ligilactobacillus equi DSM 15833 = JCM 10991]
MAGKKKAIWGALFYAAFSFADLVCSGISLRNDVFSFSGWLGLCVGLMLVLYLIEYMFDNGLILSQANIDRLKFKQAILVSLILLGFIIALIVLFELRGLLNNDFQLVILNNVN